jgi:protoporphyrinogen oxidase
VAEGLVYRDFMTVGLLLKKLKIKNESKIKTFNDLIPDNWIYVQERDVKLGRIQIFNNWSPYLVENDENILLGLEYFVNEGDEYWTMNDTDFINYAIQELSRMDMIDENDVLDGFMVRMPKTYPAYFGTYDRFDIIRNFVDKFENLFLIGRNGMHRYNNMDHSMLSAMQAVENIINNVTVKDNIWLVNAEEDYHEG